MLRMLLSTMSGDISQGVSMTVEHKLMAGETFDQFLATHRDGLYELIHGEIVEKVPTEEHAKIAGIILGELYLYLKQHPEIKAHLGPEVRYRPEGDLYNDRLPDVSVRLSDQPPVRRGAVPGMPNLAVEIKSPDDTYMSMRDKAAYYVQHGCAVVWLIYPEKRIVEVYQPGQDIDLLVAGDTLSGGEILPGFTLAVEVVFGVQ
jgi:Uma2 family endonuclease